MIWNAIILAFAAIRRNLMRSGLTVLGIIIGVASVITMVTLGDGATASVAAGISNLGAKMLQLTPGQQRRGFGGMREDARLFEEADADALANIPGITAVAPTVSKTMQVIYGNANWSSSIYGVDQSYLQVRSWPLASGREFSESELRGGAAVCLLGATVRTQLFAGQDPIGSSLRVQTISCQVIGLLAAKGQSGMGMDPDDVVLIPLRAFQRRVSGNRYVSAIQIGLQYPEDSTRVATEVEKLMRQRRRMQPAQESDFSILNPQEIMSTLTGVTRLLTTLLGAVAAVSLLVGGIGVMNIMLVSVTERTREIGVRLAIGAFDRDVMTQFLVEAVVLSSLGGVIGIAVGLAVSFVGATIMGIEYLPNPQVAVLAFAFSATVGVLFGFVPARKAASLDPIEALRHE